MLIVLMNLLVTHLSIIDREMTYKFAMQINRLIEKSMEDTGVESIEDIYHEIKNMIPKSDDKDWNPGQS